MKNYIVKLEITNNINDSKYIRWNYFETELERDKWVSEMKEEQHIWNYKTDGAVSFRDYDFYNYTKDNILNMDMSEFEGMTFGGFIGLVKNCL